MCNIEQSRLKLVKEDYTDSERRMISVSAELCLLACLILTLDLTLGLGPKKDMEFTFLLSAGSTECFYQTAVKSNSMEVEYQRAKSGQQWVAKERISLHGYLNCPVIVTVAYYVIAGSGLDVGFALISPSGHRLVSDFRRSDAIHMVDPTENGDYRLCFDNSFSKLSEKMVFFKVIINSQSSEGRGQGEWVDVAVPESMLEYKLEDIKVRMDSLYEHLEKSRQLLTVLRVLEARDRYLLEDNLWRVSFWSCLNLLVMLAVAAAQVYTLQRLFDNTKRVSP